MNPLKPSLLAAGKLALAAQSVISADAFNLSPRITQLGMMLAEYDVEVFRAKESSVHVADLIEQWFEKYIDREESPLLKHGVMEDRDNLILKISELLNPGNNE